MSGDLDLEQRYRRVLRLLEYDRPTRQEIASVVALAARLYLGGAGTPRRYFTWGQAVRLAVLAVVLVHAGRRGAGRRRRPGLPAAGPVRRPLAEAARGVELHDPHLIHVGLAELLILLAAVALVVPDAARAQTAAPSPPLYPRPG